MTHDTPALTALSGAQGHLTIELLDETTLTGHLYSLDAVGIVIERTAKNTFYPWSAIRSVDFNS